MATLTPTKDTGSSAKSSDVVYVEPGMTVTDEELDQALSIEGVNRPFVADLLSAFLTHERCGTHLYRSVAARTNNATLKARYEEFEGETLRHVEVLEELIRSSGGNPSYVSPLARATEAADSKALEATYLAAGGLDPMSQEMAMLDAVFMAETVDRANWQALEEFAVMLPDGPVREAVEAAVAEVLEEEEKHYGWAHDTRARLTAMQVSSSLIAKAGTKAEELVAQVRDWFSDDGRTTATPAKKAGSKHSTGAAKSTPQKAAAKRPAKKAPATASTKKSTAKSAAKRSTAKKAPARKSAAKRATAKKASARKSAVKRSTAKKASAGGRKRR